MVKLRDAQMNKCESHETMEMEAQKEESWMWELLRGQKLLVRKVAPLGDQLRLKYEDMNYLCMQSRCGND